MKKIYYQCRLTQESPLRIGSGFGSATDSDVMKDSRGLPFIPGTSLAGVIRNQLPPDRRDAVFGSIKPVIRDSLVMFSDAVLDAGAKFRISQRDGVGLSDNGTAIKGAKYDFEVVECESPYTAVIEVADTAADDDVAILESVFQKITAEKLSLGARTTRGYGLVSAEFRKKEFSMEGELEAWLVFDPFVSNAFPEDGKLEPARPADKADAAELCIEIGLQMEGSFTVRVNTTVLPKQDEKVAPDSSPLTAMAGRPTIPGTAWAGSFRHHMRHLAVSIGRSDLLDDIDALFGKVRNGKAKSKIRFSEAVIKGARFYTTTRTAVDRFTAAPRNQALFSEQVAQGGTAQLVIHLPGDTKPELLQLLAAALNDLHLRLLTVGGESGVGRGRCEITGLSVNGRDSTEKVHALQTDYLLPKGGDEDASLD